MFLSLEIDIKLWQIYTKIHKYTILCKSLVLNRSYSTNTQPIHCHVIQTEITWPVYCSVIEGSSGHGRISHIYTFWYNFDTVLCQFLETGTSERCLRFRFSGLSLYFLSNFLYSPFHNPKQTYFYRIILN